MSPSGLIIDYLPQGARVGGDIELKRCIGRAAMCDIDSRYGDGIKWELLEHGTQFLPRLSLS